MNKKILSVGQQIKYESIMGGGLWLISGLILSCKGIGSNVILVAFLTVALYIHLGYSIIKDRRYKKEKFDEMAIENLNSASRKVLNDMAIVCAAILTVDIIQDIVWFFLSITIPWEKYFTMTPFSCVLCVLGFQKLMTGFHFIKMERE